MCQKQISLCRVTKYSKYQVEPGKSSSSTEDKFNLHVAEMKFCGPSAAPRSSVQAVNGVVAKSSFGSLAWMTYRKGPITNTSGALITTYLEEYG